MLWYVHLVVSPSVRFDGAVVMPPSLARNRCQVCHAVGIVVGEAGWLDGGSPFGYLAPAGIVAIAGGVTLGIRDDRCCPLAES